MLNSSVILRNTFKLIRYLSGLGLMLIALLGLWGCDLPQVRAEDRIFLNLQLDYLGEYRLPDSNFDGTRVGGLSGITYDRSRNRFYAVSDDRSQIAPARFYTLRMALANPESVTNQPKLGQVTVEAVTSLKNSQGQSYAASTLDPEGIALLPDGRSVYISSEGVQGQALPFVDQFALQAGNWLQALPLPPYFLANPQPDAPPQGVGNNLGFESLTLNPSGDRLFTATESNLLQDIDPNYKGPNRSRILHFLLGEPRPTLISEHLYELAPTPEGAAYHGLVELLSVDNGGHFLSLERTFTPGKGIAAKLYQVATGAATDVSTLAVIKGELQGIQPVRKRPLLDLATLGIQLDNLEGMALGPRLADGSQTLLLVSDNNFQDQLSSQFLLFRLRQGPQVAS